MPDENVTYSTEYIVRANNERGKSIFVPNAFQKDVTEALKVYRTFKNSRESKLFCAFVTIQKCMIRTTVEDFTKTAEKMLKGN